MKEIIYDFKEFTERLKQPIYNESKRHYNLVAKGTGQFKCKVTLTIGVKNGGDNILEFEKSENLDSFHDSERVNDIIRKGKEKPTDDFYENLANAAKITQLNLIEQYATVVNATPGRWEE